MQRLYSLDSAKSRDGFFLIDNLDAKLAGHNSIIDATPDSDAFSSFSNIYGRYIYTRSYTTSVEEE